LVLLELKNPADQTADIWKAYDQIQTYKAQIPDVFQYNEVLVISDGTTRAWGPSRPTPSASCSGAPSTA
jgi:type I restriction enzyme R subunit